MARLKKRQKEIIKALLELGESTARQIAKKTDLDVNGLMQTLNNSLSGEIILFGGKQYQLYYEIKAGAKGGDPDRIIWSLIEMPNQT